MADSAWRNLSGGGLGIYQRSASLRISGSGRTCGIRILRVGSSLGTQYALSGSITVTGVAGSVICGLLSVSVMMVNNLRDLEDDAAHGKRTLMVRIGSGKGKCWCMRALGWLLV